MHESSTIDCSECDAEIQGDVELCPQCGAEVDLTGGISNEPTRQSGVNGRSKTSESRGSSRHEQTNPEAKTIRDNASDNDRGRTHSRFGFAVTVGVAGTMLLLAPVFLADLQGMMTRMAELSAAGYPPYMMLSSTYGVELFIATLPMVGGILCLFAASLRIAGVGFSASKVIGTFGILSGGIGVLMIFIV